MAKQTITVEGTKELAEVLVEEFSKATAKNIVKRMLIKAGQPIARDAAARARRLTGTLQDSYGVSEKLSRRQKSQHVKESAVEVFAGPAALVQAITEEFGTAHVAANPTLRPAFDSNKKAVVDSIAKDLAEEIEKARARAARKAAKIAGKKST